MNLHSMGKEIVQMYQQVLHFLPDNNAHYCSLNDCLKFAWLGLTLFNKPNLS